MIEQFQSGQAYQHLERALSLERQGRLDEAMLEFKRAVDADPRIATAHNALGQHYMRKGLLTKAVDEFRSATMLAPDYDNCFNLGRALSELERYPEAAAAFERCLAADSNEPSARYELAYVECALGLLPAALARFQSLVEELPDDWELRTGLADCQLGMGDYAAAVATLQEALRLAPPAGDVTGLHETLALARRHLEFPEGKPAGLKDHLYLDYGVMCLGSGADDGLDIPLYEDHAFTYRDIAITLQRLLAVVSAFNWQFSCVVAVDGDSLPLATALAKVLELPLSEPDHVHEDQLALVVLGLSTAPELCEVTLEHVPGAVVSFALALGWSPTRGPVTDIVGTHCTGQCTLPWQRVGKRSAADPAFSILRALSGLPDDPTLPQQLSYYTQQHTLLHILNASVVRKEEPAPAQS